MVLQRGGPRRGRQRCACALLWCGRSAWRAVAHARARVARSSDKCRQRPWGEKGAPPGPHQADLSACLPAGPTLTRTFRGGAGVGGIAPPPHPHISAIVAWPRCSPRRRVDQRGTAKVCPSRAHVLSAQPPAIRHPLLCGKPDCALWISRSRRGQRRRQQRRRSTARRPVQWPIGGQRRKKQPERGASGCGRHPLSLEAATVVMGATSCSRPLPHQPR